MSKDRLYGWLVIASSFLAIFCLFGYRSTFALLKGPMSAEMGWSQAQVSFGYSLMMIVYAVTAFLSGFVVDKWGARPVYVAGAVLGAAGFYVTAQVHSLLAYYVAFGVLAGVATGGLWTVSIVTVRKWFVGATYARIWGFAFAGAPIAQVVLSLFVNDTLRGAQGTAWRGAMELLGMLTLVCMCVAAFLAKRAPEAYGMKPLGEQPQQQAAAPVLAPVISAAEAYVTYPVWGAVLVFAFSTLAEFLLWTQVVSYWTSDLGMSLNEATRTYVVIGAIAIFTMPLLGIVADRVVQASGAEAIGRKRMLIAGPLIGALSVVPLLLQTAAAPLLGVLFCVLFAIYWAIVPGGIVGYLGAIYGRQSIGKIYSLVSMIVMGSGPFIGPLVGGFL
jgi:MFS family permease